MREIAKNGNYTLAEVVAAYAGKGGLVYDHAVAATVGFDHFLRVLTRPHVGAHYRVPGGDKMLHPSEDVIVVPYLINAPWFGPVIVAVDGAGAPRWKARVRALRGELPLNLANAAVRSRARLLGVGR